MTAEVCDHYHIRRSRAIAALEAELEVKDKRISELLELLRAYTAACERAGLDVKLIAALNGLPEHWTKIT